MEPMTILYTSYLDLLFENRNKQYGAYPLRKYYRKRLLTAMAIISGLVIIFASLLILFRNHINSTIQLPQIPGIVLTPVDLRPPVVQKPLASRPPAAVKHVAAAVVTAPLIVKDLPVVKPIATVEELKTAVIGIKSETGPPATGDPGERQGNNGAAGTAAKDSAEAGNGKILDRAEIMPEFPGGPAALMRYLQRNLRMPDTESTQETRVRVIVKFVVSPDGKVTGINVVQSGGDPFDHEVQRVISRMPAWKPGIQNGRKVAVYYMLPVSFIIPAGN
jgi:protein TonB